MENGRFQILVPFMSKLNAEQIINEIKSNFNEITFDVKYKDNVPVYMVGFYKNSNIFVFNLFDRSVSFKNFYQNYVYQKYIKPTMLNSEKFLVETEGVNFDYNLHRSLLTNLIPKIVLGFKKYYIKHKQETINEDFQCRT